MTFVSKQTHNNNQLLLSIFILSSLFSLCKPLNSNANFQSSGSMSTLTPVIPTLQISLNNSTQLQFRSYPRVKNFTSNRLQLQSFDKSPSSEIIFIDAEHFDAQRCSLTELPVYRNSWFAVIDLMDDCSSLDVIVNVFKFARSINDSLLRGIFLMRFQALQI